MSSDQCELKITHCTEYERVRSSKPLWVSMYRHEKEGTKRVLSVRIKSSKEGF